MVILRSLLRFAPDLTPLPKSQTGMYCKVIVRLPGVSFISCPIVLLSQILHREFLLVVKPLSDELKNALHTVHDRSTAYLDLFGPEENYFRNKVETELETKMIYLTMRCSGVGSEWGKFLCWEPLIYWDHMLSKEHKFRTLKVWL